VLFPIRAEKEKLGDRGFTPRKFSGPRLFHFREMPFLNR